MSLIKLMILDDDDEYSFNLCNSLTHDFSETLLVNYCSNSYDIEDWIKKTDPDIVLTCERCYAKIHELFRKTIIILSSGTGRSSTSEIPSIYKYKDVNKIAGDIIDCFISSGNIIKTTKESTSKVIAVFSASGGVGKTSIAVGISSICSLLGLAVFYLNLEQYQSTKLFYSCNAEYSLSEIIYYVKQRDKNLIPKLLAVRCQDSSTNVFYFKEANNPFEINELLPGDTEFLVNALSACGHYNIIVIDMDSALDNNSLEVFKAAAEVLYVITDEEICLHKAKIFAESLDKISNSSDQYTYLSHKIMYVANKVSNQALPLYPRFLPKERFLSEIPFQRNTNSKKFSIMGGPESIYNSLRKIADRYISNAGRMAIESEPDKRN